MTLVYKHEVLKEARQLRKEMTWGDVIVIIGNFIDPDNKSIYHVEVEPILGLKDSPNRCRKHFNQDLFEVNDDDDEIGTFTSIFC